MTAKILTFPTPGPAEQVLENSRPTTKDGGGEEIVVRVTLEGSDDDEPVEQASEPEPAERRSGLWWFLLGLLIGAS
jgi:hypothetical protein